MKPKYSDVTKTPKWRRTYEYRGIKYDIAIIDTWFVLEYPEETNYIAVLAKEVDERREFLYADTAHIWNNSQTYKQKFYEMVTRAKEDIDWFLDESLNDLSEVEKNICQTVEEIEKLRSKL